MSSLQDMIDSKPSLVDYFYNDTVSQYHKSRKALFSEKRLIEQEYTNWRDECRAVAEGCVLTNQSHHMPVLFVKGPDARRMLEYLSPCTFSNLATNRAKQYFACTARGYHIGDCILHYYGEVEGFELISGMPLLNWVRYHGETGGYDLEMTFDPTTPYNPTGKRTKFRFQLEGPNARAVLEEITEGNWPDLKFFHSAMVNIAGCEVQVLRHGMNAVGGAELAGAYDKLDIVRDAILKAGGKHGIKEAGVLTYYSNGLVSGWVPYPVPAIYTDEELRPYRKWLPANSWEANIQLGGSFYSESIEDYYWTPSALGYDRFVKFDHDFIGREALESQQAGPRRVRRVLEWVKEDVLKVVGSQFSEGPKYKSMDLPIPMYGWPQGDEIRSKDGELIGLSEYCAYSVTEHSLVSVCCVDEAYGTEGTEVVMTWGEPNGGSRKSHVERHEQTTVRAIVHHAPFSKVAKMMKKAAL